MKLINQFSVYDYLRINIDNYQTKWTIENVSFVLINFRKYAEKTGRFKILRMFINLLMHGNATESEEAFNFLNIINTNYFKHVKSEKRISIDGYFDFDDLFFMELKVLLQKLENEIVECECELLGTEHIKKTFKSFMIIVFDLLSGVGKIRYPETMDKEISNILSDNKKHYKNKKYKKLLIFLESLKSQYSWIKTNDLIYGISFNKKENQHFVVVHSYWGGIEVDSFHSISIVSD